MIAKKNFENDKKQDAPEKTEKEVLDKVENFFQSFLKKYENQEARIDKQKLLLEDIKDMDENTAPEPVISDYIEEPEPTKEELEQWEEEDPGYVNGYVLDYDNELGTEINTYYKTGLHTGAIRWGDYADGEDKEYKTLQEGTVLSRWGDEKGTFMCDIDVDYEDLELPIIKEKNVQSFYIVIKSFPVEVSKIAKQPWNKMGEREREQNSSKNFQSAFQYKTPIAIQNLVKEGYLKKL